MEDRFLLVASLRAQAFLALHRSGIEETIGNPLLIDRSFLLHYPLIGWVDLDLEDLAVLNETDPFTQTRTRLAIRIRNSVIKETNENQEVLYTNKKKAHIDQLTMLYLKLGERSPQREERSDRTKEDRDRESSKGSSKRVCVLRHFSVPS